MYISIELALPDEIVVPPCQTGVIVVLSILITFAKYAVACGIINATVEL